ncbi:GGDEF domain-containing protein [uncultured Ferrimonas sp.]|uniref:GGDEF domain-containing protein n=1 Tax=uncultured Ferrimonas sp. TaxID=432640 RepID=UPI002608FF83|nr:GGDEF domain-containing protein [uncultured Ferrimonas sp.]
MTSFQWNRNFVTGFASVDDQHHQLVELINELGELLTENRFEQDKAQALIQTLANYATHHFQDEEALMAANKIDPRHLQPHVEEHHHFLSEVTALQAVNNETSATYLLDFLTHWLAFHILGQDQNMARQLEQIDAGVSPAAAFEAQQRSRDPATSTLLDAISRLFTQVSTRNQELFQLNQSLEAKVTERTEHLHQANHELKTLSLTDSLTQLPNRRHGMQALEAMWQEGAIKQRPLTAMLVDADNFKQVNDRYGHDSGDRVLIELARNLQAGVRTDDMVCRLGGDEFLILCPNTSTTGANTLAQQLVAKVAALQVQTGDAHWHGSISLGVATQLPCGDNFEALIKQADLGVYAAKEAGRGCARSVG